MSRKRWVRVVFWAGNQQRRLLAALFAIIGPRASYRVMGWGARLVYRLLEPLRAQSEAQCRAALGKVVPESQVARIAETSFVHRAHNLTDLMLASRLLRADTFHRYGGRIAEPFLSRIRDAQERAQAVILVTAYYGAFDLLPVFLGYHGLHATIVYLPHDNPGFDAFRRKVRSQSGCELVPVAAAAARLGQVLGSGGTVGLVADHHREDRGMPVEFLGLPTRASRSVGLLAWRYRADVVVAGIRRLGDAFQFDVQVADVVAHEEWEGHDDPVAFVTSRYLRALERLVLADPTQYLWGYARWGDRFARQAVNRPQNAPGGASGPASTVSRGIGDRQSQIE